ncbi:PRD domain-containing protein [Companilactobacillus nuruki]|uniref:PRD domain-containing protein n=1 Tax=Companilactobacillus nuruki TaxID=1993540 RepID=UPI0014170722|nr:PRD domain-containing protein [Companilactobacillus nuruki]
MKETTEEKLKVLNRVGKLDQDSFDFVTDVDTYFESNFYSNDNEMLLIHLSVAINRMINSENVDRMPDELWQQIINKPEYKVAESTWNDLKSKAPVEFTESETQYILLHILNILRRNQND